MPISTDYTTDTFTASSGTLGVANNMIVAGNVTVANLTSNGYISSAAIKQKVITSNSDYTLSSSDNGVTLYFNSFNPTNIVIPTGLTLGYRTILTQVNTGTVTVVFANVTLATRTGTLNQIAGQFGSASLVSWANNTFILDGAIQ